jgi:hypothetical protein
MIQLQKTSLAVADLLRALVVSTVSVLPSTVQTWVATWPPSPAW